MIEYVSISSMKDTGKWSRLMVAQPLPSRMMSLDQWRELEQNSHDIK
jgi:hypothetical protein